MRNPIRRIRNFAIYLPPVLLLMTAGVLLLGVLYYPAPAPSTGGGRQTAMVTDENRSRVHAEDLLAILLADALRQLREEQGVRPRTLQFQYEDVLSFEQQPATLPMTPLSTGNGRVADHPVFIRL